jgi:hypothetical protein
LVMVGGNPELHLVANVTGYLKRVRRTRHIREHTLNRSTNTNKERKNEQKK